MMFLGGRPSLFVVRSIRRFEREFLGGCACFSNVAFRR